ncbi:DUF3237 domain-containing protein [Arthrobacter sp. R4]|uniref:DUF3237 domain-containing protein n=1 Tax=Arthrobacter sp. R4 TaxID=644417 RepID=UPI003ED925F0
MDNPLAPPHCTYLATLTVRVATPIEVGMTPSGVRRIIPITGGTVTGPDLNGVVLPGGADFQLLKTDTLTEMDAKYAIETTEGERIFVDNFAIRTGSKEDIAQLVRGEAVDPKRIYFRCTPRLSSAGTRWAWLSSRILIGTGERMPDTVKLSLFVVD